MHWAIPTAHVVGHDWGGALAWEVARATQTGSGRLVVINCPPVDVLQHLRLGDPMQALRSWYTLFFQMPFLLQWSSSGESQNPVFHHDSVGPAGNRLPMRHWRLTGTLGPTPAPFEA